MPPTPAQPRIVDLDTFASYLNRTSFTGADAVIAKGQLVAAENLVEGAVPYELVPVDGETRTVEAVGETLVRLPGGLREASEVKVDGVAVDVGVGYRLLRRKQRPAHSMLISAWGAARVEITGDWGMDCPPELLNGILALAARDHFIRLNRGADVTQGADGSATSYYDRMPTVTRAAIQSYQMPVI